jgi:hypothetical protein
MTVFFTIIYVFILENPSLDRKTRPYFIDHSDDTTKYRVQTRSICVQHIVLLFTMPASNKDRVYVAVMPMASMQAFGPIPYWASPRIIYCPHVHIAFRSPTVSSILLCSPQGCIFVPCARLLSSPPYNYRPVPIRHGYFSFELKRPGCVGIFVFDQSSAHNSHGEGALDSLGMNLGPGGAVEPQNDTYYPPEAATKVGEPVFMDRGTC